MSNTVNGAVAPTGNPVLDTLNGLFQVASSGLDKYSSFMDSKAARKVAQRQEVTPPQITVSVPTNNGNNFLSNPEKLQKGLLFVGIGLVLTVGAYLVIKKI